MTGTGPVQVTGEVVAVRRAGAHHQVVLRAPGIADRFRPGTLLSVAAGGPWADRVVRAAWPIHRARGGTGHGDTVELVLAGADGDADADAAWLAAAPAGTPVDLIGPLGRPFALPREPVGCLLVGEGAAAAPLLALAERLHARGCTVHLLLGGATEADLFGVLEARRSVRGLTVTTADGSVGVPGAPAAVLPGLLARTDTAVVYASAGPQTLYAAAAAAEAHGAWSQTLLARPVVPMPCGTGLCHACAVPVVGEDGVTRMVRACTEGPVLRGDRVRWADLGSVPEGAR